MKRKTFLTILIGIVVVVIIAVIAFLIISFWKGNQDGGQGDGFSLFPGRGGGSGVVQTPGDSGTPQDGTDGPGDTLQEVPRLRKLADFPVVALQGYYRPEKIVVERVNQTPATTTTDSEGNLVIDEPAKIETVTEILDINQLYARYIREEDGAVFTSKIANELTQKQTTLGNIPYAGDGLIGNNGKTVVYRFFNENNQAIETFMGDIEEKVIPPAVCATPLPSEVTSDSDESAITLLQEFLKYEVGGDFASDGQYGTSTRQAVRDFQTREGLDATGIANNQTVIAINNECTSIIEERIAAGNPVNLNGVFLTENITTFSLSPSSEDMIYFAKRNNETIAVTLNFATRNLKQVFTTPFSEWTTHWTSDTLTTTYTKPSGSVEGYLYTLDTEKDVMNKIFDETRGLTGLLNTTGDKVLLAESTNTINNMVLNTDTGNILSISTKTLPEKCTWANDGVIVYCAVPEFINRGLYPDDWYKGNISFVDSIWSINTETGETRQIANLSNEAGEDFDVIKPYLEENELYLFFINKKTGEPWVLEI